MIKKIIIACTLVCMTAMVSSLAMAKTIERRQRGHHVSKVQTMLKEQGFLHDSVDGIYGHNTEQAVRKFQKSKGLAVDGRVGSSTMKALEKTAKRKGGQSTKNNNGAPSKYSKVLTMEASAYSSQDPGNGNYTATGSRLTKGIVSVDPNLIPLGTKLYVEGYGYAVADDVGGAIKGNRIDLAYDSRAEALQFGRQTVKVYVL
ncbi:3D domain-containing protein [uncultured Veillonella sp.]|uniref:3D domain-containing protein n=1 Tax=uncultured Veillonella sp. TaxID=159268 RepID=UPI00260769AD|nr:3D domain-containing protein [uncultured Veillonella sp.]